MRDNWEMSIKMQAICVDAVDPKALAAWWGEAIGWRVTDADDDEVALEPPLGSPQNGVAPDLLFLRVPEGKAVKNRLHLDFRPTDQAAMVEHFERLGAKRINVGQK